MIAVIVLRASSRWTHRTNEDVVLDLRSTAGWRHVASCLLPRWRGWQQRRRPWCCRLWATPEPLAPASDIHSSNQITKPLTLFTVMAQTVWFVKVPASDGQIQIRVFSLYVGTNVSECVCMTMCVWAAVSAGSSLAVLAPLLLLWFYSNCTCI